ncbi:MAG: VOC family protein [Pseudonocardia sp.]
MTDLETLDGVGRGLAAELRAAGVRDVETLRALGAADAAQRLAELGFRDAAATRRVLEGVLGEQPTPPAAAGAAGVLGVDKVLLAVGDLDAALDHYRGRLGLPVALRQPDPPMAVLRLGAERPGLLLREEAGLPEGPPRSGAPRLWLEVGDAAAAAALLRAAGIEPIAEPFRSATGVVVEFADPWGNVVGLTDHSAAPDRARTPPG